MAGEKTVTDKDNGFKAFFKNVKEAARKRVKVGIIGTDATAPRPDGITNVQLGIVHEFGVTIRNAWGRGITVKIPQRSFLRATADQRKRNYEKVLADTAKKMLKSPQTTNVDAELQTLGDRMRGDVIKRMKAGIPPPLVSWYEAEKTDAGWPATPLIRTGQLIGAIRREVFKK